jgi:hypothetical protein
MGGLTPRLKRARHDVDLCIQTWSGILCEFLGSRVLCAYAKGSAIKKWCSCIDYVPILSDVDIHLMLADGAKLFPDKEAAFEQAMGLSSSYEERFVEANPDHLHIPRTQIVILNEIQKEEDYVPPLPRDVRVMFGESLEMEPLPPGVVRRIDLERLASDGESLQRLPMSVIDRTGPDFWVTIRQHMNWRVSPSPFRLLSQVFPDPLAVWSWNRTRIHDELGKRGYTEIAASYEAYYEAGWELFESGMKSYSALRKMVVLGYRVIAGCLISAQELRLSR